MKLVIISISALFLLSIITAMIVQASRGDTSLNFFRSNSLSKVDTKKATSTQSEQPNLFQQWTWKFSRDIKGEIVTPEDPNKFTLVFTADGRLSSTTDCNQLGGSFVRNEEFISVGPLVSTKMVCEGETLESVYASQLTLVSSYQIENKTLTLVLLKDAGIMTFTQKE